MQLMTPKEIDQTVEEPYARYMQTLYRLWQECGHPDVAPNGHPRSRALTPAERAVLMRERIGPIADRMPADAWQDHCYSPRSSQALFVEVLGVLMECGRLDLLCPERVVSDCTIAFEEVTDGRTKFDGIIRSPDGRVILTIEAKFTERGFSPCKYPADGCCDGTWWARPDQYFGCPMATPGRNRATGARYWETAVRVMNIPGQPPLSLQTCPLWSGYQLFHNCAETYALDQSAAWLLLYDERNPYFADPAVGWAERIKVLAAGLNTLSWQTLLSQVPAGNQRISRLRAKHGL